MSNDITSLNILQNGYKKVAIISFDGKMIIDNVIEIWTSHDKMIAKYAEEANYSLEIFFKVIDFVIRKKYEIRICGLFEEPVFIHHEDLDFMKDDIDKSCILMEYFERKIDIKHFADEFKNKTIYFIGEYSDLNKEGSNCETIPVFINKNSAEKYNKSKKNITESTLFKLVSFKNSAKLLIEPEKKYKIEINLSEISYLS